MILTSLFSRGFLLITMAASAGMVAQEMVSRLSSAEEQRSDSTLTTRLAWQSAETFYGCSPRAQGMFCRLSPESDTSQLVISGGEEEPLTGTETKPPATRPDSIPSDGAVAVIAQSPHRPQTDSLRETEYSYASKESSSSSLTDLGVCRESPPPTTLIENDQADVSSIPESSLIAMADQPTPMADRSPDLVEDAEPDVADILPPRAIDRADPDASSLPPWQHELSRRTLEDPGASADQDGLAIGERRSRSHDMRYVDPEQLVRERALERGRQRERRLEARRWLGYSPLRPPVQASPFTSGDQFRPIVVFVPRPIVVVEQPSASER